MRRHTLPVLLALLLAGAGATPASAQATPGAVPRPPNDSLFRRARRMVLEGNGVAGRALVDSLLAAAAPGSSAYGDALYWHGALSSTVADAERDYRRVIVEYPLAFYTDDALLALAELEQGRGDRAAALAHLQRFVKEHPASPARGIAALGAARLAFEQRDTRTACAMITEARASVGPGDVELTNQIAYYTSRCPASPPATVAKLGSATTRSGTPADTQSIVAKTGAPRAVPDSLPRTAADAPKPPTLIVEPPLTGHMVTPPSSAAKPAPVTPKPVTAPAAKAPTVAAANSRGRYTIQLAAYNTRAEAERMVATLKAKGLEEARVSGDAKPFRVRLGFYATPAAAAAQVTALKARKIISFMTTEP